jgi:hypothetical protein
LKKYGIAIAAIIKIKSVTKNHFKMRFVHFQLVLPTDIIN